MKPIFLILVAVITGVSCRKVIDIDLNSASPKYVIEGGVSNSSDPCRIKITKTKNFSEDNNFDGVANALVTISDNAGNTQVLSYTSNGMYQTTTLPTVPGRVYYLTVKIGNETFTSRSQMPLPVVMDTLYSYDFNISNDTLKMARLKFNDPAGINNYYRFVLTLNQVVKESIYINDDALTDGKTSTQTINYRNSDTDEKIESGDSVSVEMQCIDKDVYNFFFSLDQTIGQSSAAPTNPVSNISGGALGYFSAYIVQRKAIKIQ